MAFNLVEEYILFECQGIAHFTCKSTAFDLTLIFESADKQLKVFGEYPDLFG
jgi:hypothetical protein